MFLWGWKEHPFICVPLSVFAGYTPKYQHPVLVSRSDRYLCQPAEIGRSQRCTGMQPRMMVEATVKKKKEKKVSECFFLPQSAHDKDMCLLREEEASVQCVGRSAFCYSGRACMGIKAFSVHIPRNPLE